MLQSGARHVLLVPTAHRAALNASSSVDCHAGRVGPNAWTARLGGAASAAVHNGGLVGSGQRPPLSIQERAALERVYFELDEICGRARTPLIIEQGGGAQECCPPLHTIRTTRDATVTGAVVSLDVGGSVPGASAASAEGRAYSAAATPAVAAAAISVSDVARGAVVGPGSELVHCRCNVHLEGVR